MAETFAFCISMANRVQAATTSSPQHTAINGHEPTRVWCPPPPAYLVCSLCRFELNEVNLPCGHSFCRACTQDVFHCGRRCVVCRYTFSSTLSLDALPPNHMAAAARCTLRVRCRFGTQLDPSGRWVGDSLGCPHTLLLAEAAFHEATCEFAWVTCTFAGCGVALRRRDVALHEKEQAHVHALREQSCRIAAQAALADSEVSVRRLTLRAPLFAPAGAGNGGASLRPPAGPAPAPRPLLAWAQMPVELLAASVFGRFVSMVNAGGDDAFDGACALAAARATCRGWRTASSAAMRRLERFAPGDERALRLLPHAPRRAQRPPLAPFTGASVQRIQAEHARRRHEQRVYADHSESAKLERWREGEGTGAPQRRRSTPAAARLQLPRVTTLCLTRLPVDTLISAPPSGAWSNVVTLILDDCEWIDAPFIASLSAPAAAVAAAPRPMRSLRRLVAVALHRRAP